MATRLTPSTWLPAVLTARPDRTRIALTLVVAAVLLILPTVGISAFDQRTITLIAVYGIVVVGFNITHGYAGELALGQAAIFGAGAYATGIFAIHTSTDLLLGLLVGAATAGVVGLLVGIPGVRLGGWSLAMISFFLIVLFPDVINLLPHLTGGQVGLVGVPQATLFGSALDGTGLYYAAVVISITWLLLMTSYVRSRHGNALRVLAESPVLARSLGMSVTRTKVVAYVIGALPAGLAGAIYVYLQQFLSPSSFNIDLLLVFLAASIIGGSHAMAGAFFGAALLQIGPMQSTSFQQYSILSYGIFMLVGALFLAGGIGPTILRVRDGVRSLRGRTQTSVLTNDEAATEHLDLAQRSAALATLELPGRVLTISNVSKAFGGQRVLTDVSVTARPGEITAIIGPNGSGKTTLLNTVSGFVQPDTGTVAIGDKDVTRSTPHVVARLGVARTFQNPVVPDGLSVEQVVASARLVKPYVGAVSSSLRLPRYRRVAHEDAHSARQALEALGLGRLGAAAASSLPLGTRRLLEVARAVAASPTVLLLDEPASGLDESAIEELASAILALRDAGATIVLIEHNFPLVMRIADRINVLVLGEVVATGTSAEIREHPAVIESYLGTTRSPVPTTSQIEVRS